MRFPLERGGGSGGTQRPREAPNKNSLSPQRKFFSKKFSCPSPSFDGVRAKPPPFFNNKSIFLWFLKINLKRNYKS